MVLKGLLLMLTLGGAMAAAASERPPIGCRPGALDKKQRERHEVLLRTLREKVEATQELDDGVALRLPADAQLFQQVAEWVTLERRCCPFLDFTLEWTFDDKFWVRLTGDAAVKEFLKAEVLGAEPGGP